MEKVVITPSDLDNVNETAIGQSMDLRKAESRSLSVWTRTFFSLQTVLLPLLVVTSVFALLFAGNQTPDLQRAWYRLIALALLSGIVVFALEATVFFLHYGGFVFVQSGLLAV